MPDFTYAYLQMLIDYYFRTATKTQFSHYQSVNFFILQSIAVSKISYFQSVLFDYAVSASGFMTPVEC
jgi:hypothetical protein